MKIQTLAGLISLALISTPALSAGADDGHSHDELAVGNPGKAAQAKRTIAVSMMETEDGKMLFDPSEITAAQGETIRIVIKNTGEVDHEFVMDGRAENAKHKALMEKFPEMEHDDPNAVRLAPGEEGEIVWTFTKAGEFEFACLIPGHYESGMHGPLTVASK